MLRSAKSSNLRKSLQTHHSLLYQELIKYFLLMKKIKCLFFKSNLKVLTQLMTGPLSSETQRSYLLFQAELHIAVMVWVKNKIIIPTFASLFINLLLPYT